MRPNRFQQPQGGPGKMPQNSQMMMQHQQQLRVFQQQQAIQQQRVLLQQQQQQQNSGLNAAIRELQQKSQQNHRHPLNSPNSSDKPRFQTPLAPGIRLPGAPPLTSTTGLNRLPVFKSGGTIGNPASSTSSGGLMRPPVQLQLNNIPLSSSSVGLGHGAALNQNTNTRTNNSPYANQHETLGVPHTSNSSRSNERKRGPNPRDRDRNRSPISRDRNSSPISRDRDRNRGSYEHLNHSSDDNRTQSPNVRDRSCTSLERGIYTDEECYSRRDSEYNPDSRTSDKNVTSGRGDSCYGRERDSYNSRRGERDRESGLRDEKRSRFGDNREDCSRGDEERLRSRDNREDWSSRGDEERLRSRDNREDWSSRGDEERLKSRDNREDWSSHQDEERSRSMDNREEWNSRGDEERSRSRDNREDWSSHQDKERSKSRDNKEDWSSRGDQERSRFRDNREDWSRRPEEERLRSRDNREQKRDSRYRGNDDSYRDMECRGSRSRDVLSSDSTMWQSSYHVGDNEMLDGRSTDRSRQHEDYNDRGRTLHRDNRRSESVRSERGSKSYLDDRRSERRGESVRTERRGESVRTERRGESVRTERRGESVRSERRGESVRSERRGENIGSNRSSKMFLDSNGRDFDSRSRRQNLEQFSSSPSSLSFREKNSSYSRSGNSSGSSRRETDDSTSSPGLSQYRQDLMRNELENAAAAGGGANADSQSEFSRKRTQNRILDNEKWDSDMKLEDDDDVDDQDKIDYITRSCPADLYFSRNSDNNNMDATKKMTDLETKFEEDIIKRSKKVRAVVPEGDMPSPPSTIPGSHHFPKHSNINHSHHHNHAANSSRCRCSTRTSSQKSNNKSKPDDSSSSSSEEEEGELKDDENDNDEDDDEGVTNQIMNEWERRRKHPLCLHQELWYNEPGQVNDGPLCRCSLKSRKSGIRHDIYPGEEKIPQCIASSNNLDRLHHYRITMSPYTNFLTKTPTLIEYDNHEYIFEGFSLFTHTPLESIPPCKLLRFNIEYTIHFIPESPPENFTVGSLNLFSDYVFTEVLELLDLDWGVKEDGCRQFHFMPRFCRSLPGSGCKEILSMNTVLKFLIKSSKPLVDESRAKQMTDLHDDSWRSGVGTVRGMIVTKPGMKPSSIRIDQLDRNIPTSSSNPEEEKPNYSEDGLLYPLIIHQGYRPAQLSYAGDPMYRTAFKQYVKFRHLLNIKPKIFPKDKQKLKSLEDKLQDICVKKTMKREVTVELNSEGFLCTGLRADLCQHALMVPVLMSHLRFHICLSVLEEQINYKFKDRTLLQLALTHTSYRINYGTNPDHTRNSLTNCGMRQVEYGDRRIHFQNTRKRGICILLDIMSRFGKQEETISEIPHNERLEFLGDAVIEFLTSVHLFLMFPWLEEGGLSTYRMALVQNQHLSQLAKKLKLQDFMLYVHGPDLCHEYDLRHAMANCCEALMGSLFLDGGLEVVDAIFSKTLFDEEQVLLKTWTDVPKHVLQQAEPGGDRHWVQSWPVLQKLEKFEVSIGVKFNHIRLLAKALTHRTIGDNPLTLGHNQRLEFLGDTVLQLVASEYLYRHYPEHHEGHLSLLRSSLVNSRTQAMVYNDLGMNQYVILNEGALADLDMKTKQRADMLEAFIGALYIDKGLDYCWAFCNACFFPRLKDFILNQDWNDPKSQLQQCCLTLREVGGGEPDIPIYKMIESIGPTNTRKYVVAVYFRGRRLATGDGHTIQQAEMSAATVALEKKGEIFPVLQHQRKFLEKINPTFMAKKKKKERGAPSESASMSDRSGPKFPPKKRIRNIKSNFL